MTDKELLSKYFGEENSLSNQDKFLRNYILYEGWKDKGAMDKLTARELGFDPDIGHDEKKVDDHFGIIDQEDHQRDVEMDVYEQKYNFRYEEGNAGTITTHERNVNAEETVRRVDDTRKQARERAKLRKEDDKVKKKEEINKLK